MSRRYRVIIWGPGEIGGAVVRAALARPEIELVGAKAFSPHKHGKDLGELAGIGPIGVRATTSREEILAMDADCVIVTPQPRAIVEGLDEDVIALLESGKNVVTSAAYHNVSMPNWLVSAQSPSRLLTELAATRGLAQNRMEARAMQANHWLMRAANSPLLRHVAPPLIDGILGRGPLRRFLPIRATPQRLEAACRRGRTSLHGTGVHPTFMAERVGMTLASTLSSVEHMRFIEAADFSYMPDGMWGGLTALGFGRPLRELDTGFAIARAGDFYYGDVVGNIAHLLYGAHSTDVRVERSFRGIAAKRDFKVGSVTIRAGTAAALHMVHKGYLGDHHFFTNEECWYLGPDKEYRGDDLPFGNFSTPISYSIDIRGKPARLKMQLGMRGTGRGAELLMPEHCVTADQRCAAGQKARATGVNNPITHATVMAILDAVGPVCEVAPGVVIDDTRPAFRLMREAGEAARWRP